jgi:hypothetical protein
MKTAVLAVLMVATLVLAGCGSTSKNSGNINGNWTATLTDTNGTQVFAFGTSVITNGDGTLSISNFHFTSNSPCFVSDETESGTFGFSGDFNGNVKGVFGMQIQSGSPSGNTLNLAGTVDGNKISGTWTLNGSAGCTGSGNFTMTK